MEEALVQLSRMHFHETTSRYTVHAAVLWSQSWDALGCVALSSQLRQGWSEDGMAPNSPLASRGSSSPSHSTLHTHPSSPFTHHSSTSPSPHHPSPSPSPRRPSHPSTSPYTPRPLASGSREGDTIPSDKHFTSELLELRG